MKIYIASKMPIATLRENYSQGPPADFLIDDLLEISELNTTCILNDLEIALNKIKTKKANFIYEIEIKEIKNYGYNK